MDIPQHTVTRVTTKSGGTFAMPSHCSQEKYNDLVDFKFDKYDIMVTSYPKSGTTWMMNIVWLIANRGEALPKGETLSGQVLFSESVGRDRLLRHKALGREPTLFHSHLPRGHFARASECKFVYVLRHPKDVCVSFYHHTVVYENLYHFKGNFDDYVDIFCRGQTDYGDYFDHVTEWMKYVDDKNVLIVLYEDMVSNIRDIIRKVAKFMGQEDMVKDREVMENIIEHSSFDFMKQNMNKFSDRVKDGKCPVIRRGSIGDWRNHLSTSQAKLLDKKLQDYGLDSVWKQYENNFI